MEATVQLFVWAKRGETGEGIWERFARSALCKKWGRSTLDVWQLLVLSSFPVDFHTSGGEANSFPSVVAGDWVAFRILVQNKF